MWTPVSRLKPLFNVDMLSDLRRHIARMRHCHIVTASSDVNLNLAPNIQCLCLRGVGANPISDLSWPWLLHFLSNIRNGNRLAVIILGVRIPYQGPIKSTMDFWGDIDSILAGSGFPFLREVDVELTHLYERHGRMYPRDKLCADVVRGFPLLTGRGILVNPQ
jgi:hypothetical protein